MNVYRSVQIAVNYDTAIMALILPKRKLQMFFYITAKTTGLGGCKPLVDLYDSFPFLRCKIFNFVHERRERKVRDLAPPKAFHAGKVEVFEEKIIVGIR